ncbi:MAG: PAS domain-containing sensor histidine kinase [Candidatus Flexifilum sp.]
MQRSKLARMCAYLQRPTQRIVDPAARLDALMVMRAVTLTITAGLIAVVITLIDDFVRDPAGAPLDAFIGLCVLLLGCVLYTLAWRGYYMLALRLLIYTSVLIALAAAFPINTDGPNTWMNILYLILLVLPIMQTGLLLPLSELIAIAVIATIGIAGLSLRYPPQYLLNLITMNLVVWIVTVMSHHLRTHVLAQQDLRRAELAEKNAIFTLVERYSRDIILLINPDLTIRYITPNASLLTSAPPSSSIGRSFVDPVWTQFFSAQKVAEDIEAGILRLISGQDVQNTIEFKRDDGRILWLETSTSLIQTGDVQSGAVMILRDVTERRQAEEALKHERNLLRTLIDNLPDYVYVLDSDQRVILSNRGGQPLPMMEGHDVLPGRIPESGLTPRMAVAIAQENARVLKGEMIVEQEREVETLDGGRYTLVTTKVPLRNEQGEIVGLVGRTRDITRQKEAQRQALEQARQQEQLSAALEQEIQLSGLKTIFMNLISHEFRTPLARIRSAAEMLERYHDRMSAEGRGERLTVIQQAVDQLKAMLEDITMVLQFQADTAILNYTAADAAALTREIIHELIGTTGERPIILETQGEVGEVRIDVRLFRYIARNLISNALKYSSAASVVEVTLARARHSDGGDRLILTVRDHGIGMDEETRQHIFEPFYRGKNTGNVTGTGLGLKIVHDCVTLQRGSIDVDSAPGVGTTITVSLPLPAEGA